jgi:predicted GIY-YIG superfamily endonuclease
MTDWSVYVIHFDPPHKHAKHYTGIVLNVQERFTEHSNGTGGKLTKVAVENGTKLLLHTIKSGLSFYDAHALEIKLKKRHKASGYCPTCQKEKQNGLY